MATELIVEIGKQNFYEGKNKPVLLGNITDEKVLSILRDLENFPHAFVLGCLMDRQIIAEKAWTIPIRIFEVTGKNKIEELIKISLKEYTDIFNKYTLHRFNDTMANVFYSGVQDISKKYQNNASKIWANNPSSGLVVRRFLEFHGCGPKISTMAVNILARGFYIPLSDYKAIDISVDTQIRKVMGRMGYASLNASDAEIIKKARILNPEFPGIIDGTCWRIGRDYCHNQSPDCINCIVNKSCKKVGVN